MSLSLILIILLIKTYKGPSSGLICLFANPNLVEYAFIMLQSLVVSGSGTISNLILLYNLIIVPARSGRQSKNSKQNGFAS